MNKVIRGMQVHKATRDLRVNKANRVMQVLQDLKAYKASVFKEFRARLEVMAYRGKKARVAREESRDPPVRRDRREMWQTELY